MADPPTDGACTVDEDERLAARLKALAHPWRLRIVDVLAARGSCVCGEIVKVLPLAQATVSQHLKILKGAGLVRGTIDGPRSCYCLDTAALAELRRVLDERIGHLAGLCGEGCRPSGQTASDRADGHGTRRARPLEDIP